MTLELAPGAVDTDGTFLVIIVPKTGVVDINHPTVAELTAPTAKKITYSLTTDGWNHARTEDSGTDDRLTLKQVFETQGKTSDTLELTYVYGAEDDVADPLLVPGYEGIAYARYAVANETAVAADQEFDAFPFKAGTKRKNPPAANAKWTKTQKLFIEAPGVQDDVKVSAGS